jgi:MFS family permease
VRVLSELWRDREFLKLWAGQTISTFGSQVTTLALPLTAIIVLNATPFQMGVLAALSHGAFILVGLFAGAWVDRFRRRPLMIVADLGRAVLLAAVPLAALLHGLRIELLCGVAFVVGGLSICADVAYDAYLPALVNRRLLASANSAGQISQSVAEVVGPGIAGLLIHALSAPIAIAVDAGSFLVSAASLAAIRVAEPRPRDTTMQDIAREIGVGLRVVLGHRWLRVLTGNIALVVLFASMFQVVFVLYLDATLHLDPGLIGLIFALGSLGGLVSALLTPIAARRHGFGPAAVLGVTIIVVGGQGYVIVALATPPHPIAVPLLVVTQCLVAAGNAMFNITTATIQQHVVPSMLLGRVGAAQRVLAIGVTGLVGSLLGGFVGSALSPRATIVPAATSMLSAVAWMWLSPLRTTRDLLPPLEDGFSKEI